MRGVTGLWIGLLALTAGCAASPPALTEEVARDALVRGIREAKIDDLELLAEELESIPADRITEYHGSRYHVVSDLPDRSANITVFFKNRRVVYGVTFASAADGTWRTTIARKSEVWEAHGGRG